MLVITPPIRLESTIYNTKGVHARHYTTDTISHERAENDWKL